MTILNYYITFMINISLIKFAFIPKRKYKRKRNKLLSYIEIKNKKMYNIIACL